MFNDGVRSRNFGPMTSHFHDTAEMSFEGIPVGPFKGLEAIERAYATQPPDDEIVILNVREKHGENVITCDYAWSKKPKVRAGQLTLSTRGDMIEKLTVRYER